MTCGFYPTPQSVSLSIVQLKMRIRPIEHLFSYLMHATSLKPDVYSPIPAAIVGVATQLEANRNLSSVLRSGPFKRIRWKEIDK